MIHRNHEEQIQKLLDSMVRAMSEAIDAQTPYNANHTRSMVRYGSRFLDWLEERNHPWRFDDTRRRTFLLSVWLHDVGKLTVPLPIMDKHSRLGHLLEIIRCRFDAMALLDRIALLEGRLSPRDLEDRKQQRDRGMALIRQVNTAEFLTEETLTAVDALARQVYTDGEGRLRPWLTKEELQCLRVRNGTLTDREREIMKSHVTATARILSQVSFPEEYAQVPRWAADHHERLDGSGYPAGKRGAELPREVRLMSILDVFDALTAVDRPYKPPVPPEKALEILDAMVREGALDGEILALFRQSRAWEEG